MRVGPMPLLSADKLMRVLEKNGHEAELIMSGDIYTPEDQKTAHPRTEQLKDLCYIDFDEAYIEFVRPDLVRLALLPDEEHVSTGDELEGTDWMCPTCGKSFDHPGKCPTHQLELITFEDFASGKRTQSTAIPTWLLLVLMGAGVALFMYFKRSSGS